MTAEEEGPRLRGFLAHPSAAMQRQESEAQALIVLNAHLQARGVERDCAAYLWWQRLRAWGVGA